MLIALIISALIIMIYSVSMVIVQKEIPISLSSTYYTTNKAPWFTLTMFASTFCMMPALFEMTDENHVFLVFLSCLGALICGAAPNFKEAMEHKLHYIGAFLSAIFSQIWCSIYYGVDVIWFWVLVGTILAFISGWDMRPKWLDKVRNTIAFWLELICYAWIYVTAILSMTQNNAI